MSETTRIVMAEEVGDKGTHDVVRAKYAAAALRVGEGGCCGGESCCGEGSKSVITSGLYEAEATMFAPSAAVQSSLGCGNPVAVAALLPGQTVLDLGSGGGLDVILSARRVGPTGKAYGLDMTDEMLDLARRNAHEAGVENVEFLKGYIERIPLPNASIDVVLSNCVVNLSSDKAAVLREAHRVLRPGGRLAISDVVVVGDLSPEVRADMEAWAGCVSGALCEEEYRTGLAEAGFTEVEVVLTRTYSAGEALGENRDYDGGSLASAFIRAVKIPTSPA